MPSHELIYFDGAGRAEIVRICLTIAKADWKDTRFAGKDWPTIKPTTPLGSVPVLKIDGVDHVQSMAMARYAGRLAGLYPEDPLAALVVDEVMDSVNELMSKAPRSADPLEFERLRKDFQATIMTKYATFFEGIIQRNGGVGVTSSFTIADMAIHSMVKSIAGGSWDHIDTAFFESYPGISATAKLVDDNDQIKAYYAATKN